MDDPGGVAVGSGQSPAPRATAPPAGKAMCWDGEGTIMSSALAQKRSTASSGNSLRCSADQ